MVWSENMLHLNPLPILIIAFLGMDTHFQTNTYDNLILTTDYPTGPVASQGAGGGKNDGFVPSGLRIGDTP